MLDKDFKLIINEIKNDIKKTRVNIMISANTNLINLYFRLGKIVFENKKYGNYFIKKLSTELKLTFPNMTGFSERNIRAMKLFYQEYCDDEKWLQTVAKLPWSHNLLLINKIKDKQIRKIYVNAIIKNGWGRNMLALQIDNNYHLRIGNSKNNFKKVLLNSDLASQTLKDPYIFDFISLKENYKEKELELAILNRIRDVLLELGSGFSFVGNQYKISTLENDYYLDLLFYHLELKSYIVVELKTTSFKPEYIGQIGFYVKAVDHSLKKEEDNPTIGLLLCRDKDKLSVDWALESSSVPIGVADYKLNNLIPKDILNKLPTEEEINLHINLIEESKN